MGSKSFSPNESVILDVALEGDDLTIRIDRNGLCASDFSGDAVTNLVLVNLVTARDVYYEFHNAINKPIHYEISNRESKPCALFWINNSVDEIKLYCNKILELGSSYTQKDWAQKGQHLGAMVCNLREESSLYGYMFQHFSGSIQRLAKHETEIARRKVDFHRTESPAKAAYFEGQAQAYERIQNLATQKIDESSLSVIENWILREWDSELPNPQAYREIIRHKIIEMGENAIYPLMIIFLRQSKAVREEVLTILHMIRPEVADAIVLQVCNQQPVNLRSAALNVKSQPLPRPKNTQNT